MIENEYYIIINKVIIMLERLQNIKNFYKTLGSNTKLMIRITFITVICLLLAAIYAYTATHTPFHFELLKISDDLLECTKSVAVIGFTGTLILNGLEK